ncbi:MAG: thiamine pyrophosphate-binding protein [Pirellulales bacterium]
METNRSVRLGSGRLSIGAYLIKRLQDYGIQHVFGIPGDYILAFYGQLEQSPIEVVGTTREDCAGFAADAYARVHGMGAVCVTYCVGGLSICNSVAGAYAEKSPVVVISGSPGLGERKNNPLLHHKVRNFRTQLDVFERICIAVADLSDPIRAFGEIDRVLDACYRYKRPVYIELPRDMVNVVPQIGHLFEWEEPVSDPQALAEAVEETAARLEQAERPMILAGVELHRFQLQDQLLSLAESARIPIATTLLGKSVIGESHPLYIGIYEGALGREEVTRYVEESDCLLMLGTFMTDINLGIYTAQLDPARCILATSEQLRIRHHHFADVQLPDYLAALTRRRPQVRPRPIPPGLHQELPEFHLRPEAPLKIERMIARLNQQLDEETIAIADIGDSFFSATELVIRRRTEFVSPAYYTSMGFSVPAALGAQAARPDARVLVICGDGAFQMTGQEFSTLVRRGYDPVVIVLNNGGYGTERQLHPGDWEFNEIHSWQYHLLPQVYGGGRGYEVRTEGEFDTALREAWDYRDGPSLIHVHLDRADASQTLSRLAARLGQRV